MVKLRDLPELELAHHAADAGDEFVFTEGLADEVVCPELEADDDVDLLAFCGEK